MSSSSPHIERIDRWLRASGFAFALLLAMVVGLTGSPADEQLRLARDTIRNSSASGKIVIVEIDAKSLAQIAEWPWPRSIHANLIDKLRAAGANLIAFDVDFSAASNPRDDAAMSNALQRAGGAVILPTFRQKTSSLGDSFAENLPIAPFRDHAFLGSVNVQPDADGQLRLHSYGTETGGTARPSVAALLAGAQGRMGQNFRVDTAFDPATIPRISAVDVIQGRIPPGALAGKSVLIGATAIEMGDRYVVPGRGVLPGVVVQVLAAETLMHGTMNPDFGPAIPLGIAIAAIALIAWRRWHPAMALLAVTVIAALPVMLELTSTGSVQIIPAVILLAVDALILGALHMKRKFTETRLVDPVTGLPNARALEKSCRTMNVVTVMVVSVTQFEEIDAVLSPTDKLALTSHIIARLALGFPGTVVHFAGPGSLAIPLSGPANDALHDQVDAVSALFRAPVALGQRALLVTPAFGVSTGSGFAVAELLAQARFAVRKAQDDGRRLVIHSDAAVSNADRSLTLLSSIDEALAGDQIHVLFQPKWHVASGRITGGEALVRWTHPDLGRVGPDEFIPLLEDNGQIRALTERVIDLCLDQQAAWKKQNNPLAIAINISAALLDDVAFTGALLAKLGGIGGDARHITLEVTESATVTSTEAAVAALTALRELGARISIDDYGTGHATLAYLKSFPADEIKIDKSFVTGMLSSKSDEIVVRSTIELAHELGFSVVAEGVEDAACAACLAKFGCDTLQGWEIGKPMRAEELVALTETRRKAA